MYKQHFELCHTTPGVYYFHDAKGKIIYVGKAINIRSRVNSHFSNNSETRQKQNFITHIHSISFKSCATELMACILESVEIKKYWPKFNYPKSIGKMFLAFTLTKTGMAFFVSSLKKIKRILNLFTVFHNLSEGYSWLRTVIVEHKLCPKLCFWKGNGRCTGVENKTCKRACITRKQIIL
jgi:DNA polymerase-3 subunit epsilon